MNIFHENLERKASSFIREDFLIKDLISLTQWNFSFIDSVLSMKWSFQSYFMKKKGVKIERIKKYYRGGSKIATA